MIEFNFTFKGMDSSPSIAQYAEKKFSRLERYFYGPVHAHVILRREKFREIVEVILSGDGETIVVKEETDDIYSSIDFAYESLEKQVKKLKEKKQEHRPPRVPPQVATERQEGIIVQTTKVNPLTTQDAIKLFLNGKDKFFLFYNTDYNKICCFYREGENIVLLIPEIA